MKKFIVIFFAAWTVVCGLLVNWGYTIPDYWDEPEWVPMTCKIVGFIGLVCFPMLGAKAYTEETMIEEDEQ